MTPHHAKRIFKINWRSYDLKKKTVFEHVAIVLKIPNLALRLFLGEFFFEKKLQWGPSLNLF